VLRKPALWRGRNPVPENDSRLRSSHTAAALTCVARSHGQDDSQRRVRHVAARWQPAPFCCAHIGKKSWGASVAASDGRNRAAGRTRLRTSVSDAVTSNHRTHGFLLGRSPAYFVFGQTDTSCAYIGLPQRALNSTRPWALHRRNPSRHALAQRRPAKRVSPPRAWGRPARAFGSAS